MTVSVQIHSRDLSVTPRLREYVEKKVSRLDHYLPNINEARVDLAEVKSARSADDREVAQLTVVTRGVVLRAEESKDDIFAAVDAVLDKMHRQIERYKGKHWRNRKNGGGVEELVEEQVGEAEAQADQEPEGSVVRRKSFMLTPMSESEALEQMRLVGHELFFVFYNADTNRVNVLYRRKNGDFGLIDAVLG
jgi:putative sigma-54 modulation protein